ncbi:MAG: glutamine synthetase family protein [Candidatus Helarchaeota archaeon]
MPIDYNDKNRFEICKKVVDEIKQKNIKFIRLQFTDINGILKSVSLSAREIEHVLEYGQGFDGSSITGFGAIEESDLTLIPDPTTFTIVPWREKSKASGRFLCDIYNPDGTRYEGDPRYCLQKAIKRAENLGFKMYCAPELEFFVLQDSLEPQPMDMGGYFSLSPGDVTEDLRREICDMAENLGINIEMAHHEVALGQNEIDFKYSEVLETADRTVTLKMLIKTIASLNGFIATFMPKPFMGINGSGMHIHQSLWNFNNENVFYSPEKEKNYLSDTALHWIGGQLKFGREICAILASWPNSYKRLIPGYEAPVYIAWGFRNRSPLIRVPDFGGRPKAARVEIRCPDPAGNPYLQFAILLHAGLEGIEKKIEPPEPTDLNVYDLNYDQRKELGIISLPESLSEALNEMKKSSLVKKALGDQLYKNFLKIKFEEWDEYRIQVTKWEINRYLKEL